jgi:hypothetical protein
VGIFGGLIQNVTSLLLMVGVAFIDRNGPFVLASLQDTGNSKLGYLRFVYPSHVDDPLDLFSIRDILVERAP